LSDGCVAARNVPGHQAVPPRGRPPRGLLGVSRRRRPGRSLRPRRPRARLRGAQLGDPGQLDFAHDPGGGGAHSRLLAARGHNRVMLGADAAGLPRAMRTFERVGFTVLADPSTGTLDLGGGPEDRLSLLRQIAIESIARVYYRLAGFY